ncbi:VMAP-C domain-containing protein [Streptomyces daghestanicus]|uniref:Serine protease n=1 Tax=Streptomyces daghestanicus TaxID=66885 RepID=A0ABQ3Q139_9ACTN|nr:trypsin-like peptidase domain-containing protein [Streptomyces daghestanicus]GGU45869.1 serine protease [Streptomyces daghestanicus]GHI31008.1 serine protease [Streptomyces daghestanicus]
MTGGYAPGAPGDGEAARRALGDLVMAATVRVHRPGAGYAPDEPAGFLGSGFFIAPNWVLTCAHVACEGEGGEVAVVYEPEPGGGMSAVTGHVVATLPEGAAPATGNWPAPDLALIRLSAPADHECVYVSERPAGYYGDGKVLYAGWTELDGRLQMLYGTLTVEGTIGTWSADLQLRLGENDLPDGVSGGPVIDPLRGEVIGIVKSRARHARGGTSIGLEQLRTLPVPAGPLAAEHDDLYHSVFQAHDRYHRDRQRLPDARRHTWVDVQRRLGARPGRTLTPEERVQLLGRLADLPPPASTHALLDILDALPDFQAPLPRPAPRGWRDGLGALYESARDDGALDLVLDYAVRAMVAERPYVVPSTQDAEEALWDWVWQAGQRLGIRHRRGLADQRFRGMTARRPGHRRGAPGTGRRPPLTAQPAVLVELEQRHWEPDHCDWSVSVVPPGKEARRLDEAAQAPLARLAEHLSAALTEAFRQCDEPGRPAVLQVALPYSLLGRLSADDWRLGPDAPPVGALRPVVLRCSDRDRLAEDDAFAEDDGFGGEAGFAGDGAFGGVPAADPFDLEEERRARWRWLHSHRAKAEVLDCDEGLRKPVPPLEQLRGLSHGAVPVLCRYGDDRYDDDAVALARIVRGGFGVALWRRRRGLPDTVCGEFHRGSFDEIAGPPSAHRLPEVVHDLRRKLRAGRPETFWAAGVSLLYDDPHQPLPGAGDLLEAP